MTSSVPTVRHILREDQALPPDQQRAFVFRPLTMGERMGVYDGLSVMTIAPDGTKTQYSRTWQQSLELFLTQVTAIENFPAGAPQPWPATREERVAYIERHMRDAFIIAEVATAIRDGASVSEAAKN